MSDRPGPTGKYPRGKLCEDDRGELAVRIQAKMSDNGQALVVLDFNTSVTWLAIPPEAVDELCKQLQKQKHHALLLGELVKVGPEC